MHKPNARTKQTKNKVHRHGELASYLYTPAFKIGGNEKERITYEAGTKERKMQQRREKTNGESEPTGKGGIQKTRKYGRSYHNYSGTGTTQNHGGFIHKWKPLHLLCTNYVGKPRR